MPRHDLPDCGETAGGRVGMSIDDCSCCLYISRRLEDEVTRGLGSARDFAVHLSVVLMDIDKRFTDSRKTGELFRYLALRQLTILNDRTRFLSAEGNRSETRNPKHEIRNPKQIQNANVKMFKTAIAILLRATTRRTTSSWCHFEFLSCWFVSDLGFRIRITAPTHVAESCTVIWFTRARCRRPRAGGATTGVLPAE